MKRTLIFAVTAVILLSLAACGTTNVPTAETTKSPEPSLSATATAVTTAESDETPTPTGVDSTVSPTPTATDTPIASAKVTAMSTPTQSAPKQATASPKPSAPPVVEQTKKPPTAPPTLLPTQKPPTPTPTQPSIPGIGYTDVMVYADAPFLDALLEGLNESRGIQGTARVDRDKSGTFYKRAEEQARKSALAGRPVHSEIMDGNESIAKYPYYLDWSGGRAYGNQAAVHAPNLMADGFSQVGICAIAYKSDIYVVFYSTDWPF